MITAIIIGRKGSKGFPNKNHYEINGLPLAWYSMHSACKVEEIDKVFVATDDNKLMEMAKTFDFGIVKLPPKICDNTALAGDAYRYAYRLIPKSDILVLLMCNAYAPPEIISKGIKILQKRPELDSAVTVSRYNMYSPIRAKRIVNGLLESAIKMKGNEDRNSTGDFWFSDCGAYIIRPHCLFEDGIAPQKWIGKKAYPLKQECGLDIDFEWQIGQMEWHIKSSLQQK